MIRRIAAAAALLATACGPPRAGPGLPGGPTPPEAAAPAGEPAYQLIGESGGTLALQGSAGDALTVAIPPGAVAAPTEFTLTEVAPNTALGAAGSAFRLAPAGALLSAPLTLTFSPASGTPVGELTAAHQDPSGYWFRAYSAQRDAAANTLAVTAGSGGDWTLVTTATQRDLHGPVQLDSTQTVPFTASGEVVLQFLGEDDAYALWAPTGTLAVPSPIPSGAASCTPQGPNPFPLLASIAELHKLAVPADFHWGLNAQWPLSCDDGTRPLISTNFDTLGITNMGCTRAYSGSPTVDPWHLRGRYVIDCGTRGSVAAAWELVPPDVTPGALP